MKKLVVLLFSLSLIIMFGSTKDNSVQKSSQDIVSMNKPFEHPIQPPIG